MQHGKTCSGVPVILTQTATGFQLTGTRRQPHVTETIERNLAASDPGTLERLVASHPSIPAVLASRDVDLLTKTISETARLRLPRVGSYPLCEVFYTTAELAAEDKPLVRPTRTRLGDSSPHQYRTATIFDVVEVEGKLCAELAYGEHGRREEALDELRYVVCKPFLVACDVGSQAVAEVMRPPPPSERVRYHPGEPAPDAPTREAPPPFRPPPARREWRWRASWEWRSGGGVAERVRHPHVAFGHPQRVNGERRHQQAPPASPLERARAVARAHRQLKHGRGKDGQECGVAPH